MMNLLYIRNRLFEGSVKSWEKPRRAHRPRESQSSPSSAEASPQSGNNTSQPSKPPSPNHQSARTPSETKSTTPSAAAPSNTPPSPAEMAEQQLQNLIQQLHQSLKSRDTKAPFRLLSQAKIGLLHLNALVPNPQTPKQHLLLAREILELGALASIRDKEPESFTRYYQQLQPFYSLPSSELPKDRSNQSKITGLYLLLLLSQGDYAGFHTVLEALEMSSAKLDGDENILYPIRLEQALMEGSYDRVWGETKGKNVPSEEFRIFSEVLIDTIRSEIASCSEKAYPSIPISNAKNLFFLDSEGAVVQFAQQRGWVAKDGRIYFPQLDQDGMGSERDILVTSDKVIENTLGYARELETIV